MEEKKIYVPEKDPKSEKMRERQIVQRTDECTHHEFKKLYLNPGYSEDVRK